MYETLKGIVCVFHNFVVSPSQLQWNVYLTNLDSMKSSVFWTILLAPVGVQYKEKNFDIRKPCYSEHILQVPWPFVKSRLHYWYCFSALQTLSKISDSIRFDLFAKFTVTFNCIFIQKQVRVPVLLSLVILISLWAFCIAHFLVFVSSCILFKKGRAQSRIFKFARDF